MPKVIIDGVVYVPVTEANPAAEQIARGIMEGFWGELPPGYDWQHQADDLRVNCSDSLSGEYPTVTEVVAAISRRISAKG